METDALLDAYVRDVVRLLPQAMRTDVAVELRGLVLEELQARAAAEGRILDARIALDGIRAFGKPREVAARYFEPWTIIPQTETRRFVSAAIIGALVLIALSPLSSAPARPEKLAIAILAWLGALVTYFAVLNLNARRKSAATPWVPHDDDRVSRFGTLAIIAIICLGMLAYGAPGWLFAAFSHGGSLPAWLDYDAAFQSSRLPVLFFLWGCQAILLMVLAIRGRWNPHLRRIDVGLEFGVVLVLFWFLAAGRVFREAAPNKVALSAITACALLLVIDAVAKLYRATSRIRPADGLRSGGSIA